MEYSSQIPNATIRAKAIIKDIGLKYTELISIVTNSTPVMDRL